MCIYPLTSAPPVPTIPPGGEKEDEKEDEKEEEEEEDETSTEEEDNSDDRYTDDEDVFVPNAPCDDWYVRTLIILFTLYTLNAPIYTVLYMYIPCIYNHIYTYM